MVCCLSSQEVKSIVSTASRATLSLSKELGRRIFNKKIPVMGIYAIKHIPSGKLYIGSAIDIGKRWRSHINLLRERRHHSPHLQHAWDLYGEEQFCFIVLEVVNKKEMLIQREQYWLDKYESYKQENGYNQSPTAGNCLGFKHTQETKRKWSIKRKGRKLTEEHKAKIGAANKGKKRLPSTIEKMRKSRKGRKLSEEHKAKIRASCKGINTYKRSLETRKKISLAKMGSKPPYTILTEEQVREIKIRRANGESQRKLAKEYGVSRSTIQYIDKGRIWRLVKA